MVVGIKLLTVLFLVTTACNSTWTQSGGGESRSAAPRLGVKSAWLHGTQ